jgi:hypothetical protein
MTNVHHDQDREHDEADHEVALHDSCRTPESQPDAAVPSLPCPRISRAEARRKIVLMASTAGDDEKSAGCG